jgi:hypothetical protein
MAQYFKDFSILPAGAFVDPDFTTVNGATAISDSGYAQGNALLNTGNYGTVALTGFKHPEDVSISWITAKGTSGGENRASTVYSIDGSGYLFSNASSQGYAVRWFGNFITVFRGVGGAFAQIAQIFQAPPIDGTVLRFTVAQSGANKLITVAINGGAPIASYTDTAPLTLPAGGGIVTYTNSDNTNNSSIYALGVGTGGDAAPTAPTGPDYTQRKGSTFTATHTLGTITTATLNAVNVFDHVSSQAAGTISFTGSVTDERTTSGVVDLVLGDGAATQTQTVQVNVFGVVPSNNPAQKDGSALASLTGVQIRVTDGANLNGTEVYYSPTQTTDASGNFSTLDVSTSAAVAADPVRMQVLTAAGDSITSAETVGLI